MQFGVVFSRLASSPFYFEHERTRVYLFSLYLLLSLFFMKAKPNRMVLFDDDMIERIELGGADPDKKPAPAGKDGAKGDKKKK
jgi:hypothetical protein